MSRLTPIASGAACEVFALPNGKVLKAFFDIVLEAAPTADPTLAPRVAFSAEHRAYQLLGTHPDLEIFAPRFFGTADPRDYSLDSAKAYSSGCGLILERIPGEDSKIGILDEPVLSRVDAVLEDMKERIGLDDPWDASCFVPGTRADFTVIDFATPTTRLVELDKILRKYGAVPANVAPLLGL